jgi:S-adenosylmethionine decarboxylase
LLHFLTLSPRGSEVKIRQLFVDARGCKGKLNDPEGMDAAMRAAVTSVGANIVGSCETRFVPHGVTSVLILAESHFIISTWPEYELTIADIFLCNEEMDPRDVWNHIAPFFQPNEVDLQWVVRTIDQAPVLV